MQTTTPAQSSSLDARVEDVHLPLIYKRKDGTYSFVHDSFTEFFLARYFADEINNGRITIEELFFEYFADINSKEMSHVVRTHQSTPYSPRVIIYEKKEFSFVINFMGELLKRDFALGLIEALSLEDSKKSTSAKRHYFQERNIYETPRGDNLAFEICYNLNVQEEEMHKHTPNAWNLVQKMESYSEGDINSEDDIISYFKLFSWKAQRFIFKRTTQRVRYLIIQSCLSDEYSPPILSEGSTLLLNKGFKFDEEDTKLILDYLSKPTQPLFMSKSELLPDYLEKNDQTLNLWIDYFTSEKPNYFCAVRVLGHFGDKRALKPLIDYLRKIKSNDPPFQLETSHYFFQVRGMVIFVLEAIMKIGGANALKEIMIDVPPLVRGDVITTLLYVAGKGNLEAKQILEAHLTDREKEQFLSRNEETDQALADEGIFIQ